MKPIKLLMVVMLAFIGISVLAHTEKTDTIPELIKE